MNDVAGRQLKDAAGRQMNDAAGRRMNDAAGRRMNDCWTLDVERDAGRPREGNAGRYGITSVRDADECDLVI